MKIIKATGIAAVLALSAGAAVADTTLRIPPVLELPAGLCPSTRNLVVDWARHHSTYGAFAIPTQPHSGAANCAVMMRVETSRAQGFDSSEQAVRAALGACQTANAGRTDLGRCVIVGVLRPGPV